MNKPPIGAVCSILFDDGDRVDGYYISFSEPPDFDAYDNEDVPKDAFGVPDDKIFYYAPDGEAMLIELMKDNPRNDFKILSYKLEH
jgi:hypothetical protein